MMSRSCLDLSGLASGDITNLPQVPKGFPYSTSNDDNEFLDDNDFQNESRRKTIIVAKFLPVNGEKDPKSGMWSFSWDKDSLFLQMKDGISSDSDVYYVGSLKVDIEEDEEDQVSQTLYEEFKCLPTFLSSDLNEKYYHGFCEKFFWPLVHYALPITPGYGNFFDNVLWQAYITANTKIANKVREVLDAEKDFVWVHDYHLMLLPIFLRRRYPRVKIGFFLHSPFPSSEIFRTLPVREKILNALLNADLIGFHTFDYARHFISCCSRMLGVGYESKRGRTGLQLSGRTVFIKISPIGIHLGRLESALSHPSCLEKVKEIQERLNGKKIILGVDDMDAFKGIGLKLLAFERLLNNNPMLRGKLVAIQIVNPARSTGRAVQEAQEETYMAATRINDAFGRPGYDPVILIDQALTVYEKTAYYVMADCCIVNCVREGMNLIPYEYTVCRQRTQQMNEALGISSGSRCTSSLVISEFVGCSRSLSGAIRINPWSIEDVENSLITAIGMDEEEMELRHEKHHLYVKSHDVAYWVRSFMEDLEKACEDNSCKRCLGLGFGLSSRVFSLSPNFRKLSIDDTVSGYKNTSRRAIFLDYDGTIVPQACIVPPSRKVISAIKILCSDPKNTVFMVSGRAKSSLSSLFSGCKKLSIVAEHGFFIRWNGKSDWDNYFLGADLDWKNLAKPIMQVYTETTDGSYIEEKESALVWHHEHADRDLGPLQAKELLDHLENILSNDPVAVKSGDQTVEVNLQGVTKGLIVDEVISKMVSEGKAPDFVLCIGDGRADEDMFEKVSNLPLGASAEVFACTIGQKPSEAEYYLDGYLDVIHLLQRLAAAQVRKEVFAKMKKLRYSTGKVLPW